MKYKLTKEEKKILKDVREGKYVSVLDEKRKEEFVKTAKNTMKKNKNINLRISERTLNLLKSKALEEGLPYQTLATSIIHKYVS